MFSGTCRQALNVYAESFDSDIVMMQIFKDSPIGVPDEFEQRIFNAGFRAIAFVLWHLMFCPVMR
ncbi:hypothetical protein GF337_02885 [candidate division KSB1 bacterium]|nr:hypothetical protein [candidate division KSB1 bacterium]